MQSFGEINLLHCLNRFPGDNFHYFPERSWTSSLDKVSLLLSRWNFKGKKQTQQRKIRFFCGFFLIQGKSWNSILYIFFEFSPFFQGEGKFEKVYLIEEGIFIGKELNVSILFLSRIRPNLSDGKIFNFVLRILI